MPEPGGESHLVEESKVERAFPGQKEGRDASELPGGKTGTHPSFQQYLQGALEAQRLLQGTQGAEAVPFYAILQAVDAGESVESVAKRFGRGKGEIELILNLRRSKGWYR
ncbi:hypothetical protein V3F56_02445 [Moorellaceae bacterium AZ2]